MSRTLTPPKALLLAVHLAAHADVRGLEQLAAQHPTVLHKHILLRILLTHLPETVKPDVYVEFLQAIAAPQVASRPDVEFELDTSPVGVLSEQLALKRARKLHLAQLKCHTVPALDPDDSLGLFLVHRTHNMDAETGMLALLPDLLIPFSNHSHVLRTWIASTVLPFVRRNVEYYAETSPAYSLAQFQSLDGPDAVIYFLARSAGNQSGRNNLARDLRGLVGPWLYDSTRWVEAGDESTDSALAHSSKSLTCPGWEQVLEWLISQTTASWRSIADAMELWDGPADVDFAHQVPLELSGPKQSYLEESYARAVLASSYMMPKATADSLSASYRMCAKVRLRSGDGQGDLPLQNALCVLPETSTAKILNLGGTKAATHMRNDLLQSHNPLTSPSDAATSLLMTLIMSAFILTQLGVPCSVKRAGDLAFLGDEREQKGEIAKLFHAMSGNSQLVDEEACIKARRQILWLHNWGQTANASTHSSIRGVFSMVPREHLESELLKALLAKSHYTLARRLFEDGPERPLDADVLQQVVFNAALHAFDNASNPNRTRGGLKQCDDIIHAFPTMLSNTLPGTKRIQALLRAMHALSEYRLVLKQGEPFSPVVLRVHSDPISIIDKVLQQNLKAYTRLQEFVEVGFDMVRAGLPSRGISNQATSDLDTRLFVTERRIVAMCVEAALREDDFETAYSYVVSRLATSGPREARNTCDCWSWQAALVAGQYLRTDRSQQPTHLGTASGNPEIRHLEQRMECLATALRVAPTCQLQDILKTFRRCEERLDSAIKEEAASEAAWDARAVLAGLPGTYDAQVSGHAYPPRNMTAAAAARQAEEAPMSLFDLSRATARIAPRNLGHLSNLPGVAAKEPSASVESVQSESGRVRKRDQLREAATGTLVSSVGWLIGANVNSQSQTEANE